MVDVVTAIYDFVLPEVGGSDDTWGDKLNANFLKLENILAGMFPGGSPTGLGERIVLSGGSPRVEFTETDAATPAGRFRFIGLGAGSFALQKDAAPGNWSAPVNLLSTDGALFTFSLPVTSTLSATFGTIEINVAAGVVARSNGALVFNVPTTFLHHFRINNVDAARVDPAGAAMAGVLSIVTQEKGDARYARTDGSNPFTSMSIESGTPALDFHETDAPGTGGGRFRFSGIAAGQFAFQGTAVEDWSTQFNIWRYLSGNLQVEVPLITTAPAVIGGILTTKPGTSSHISLDNTTVGGSNYDINPINPADANAMLIRFGRSSPVGNLKVVVSDPGTTAQRVILDSAGTGKVTAGVGDFGDYLIGAAAAGTVDTTLISAKTGSPFNIRSGLNTGVLARVQMANATTAASFDINGTAASGATTVITREKGDLRYAAASSQRYKRDIAELVVDAEQVLHQLRPFSWVWGGELPESDERVGRPGLGLVAEKVLHSVPEAVTYRWAGDDTGEMEVQGLDPLALIGLLVKAVNRHTDRLTRGGL